MEQNCDEKALAFTADVIVRDFMCVKRGENVLITTDSARSPQGVLALYRAAVVAGAKPVVLTIPQLPFQGSLADPYLSDIVVRAVDAADVWFDMAFPYMAGSKVFNAAMATERCRSLLLADLSAAGMTRIFGFVDLDQLFEVQGALDEFIAGKVGKECRVQSANGTDFRFVIAKPATRKLRHTNEPGFYTPPGSAVMYPEDDSVVGTACIEAAYHEYFTALPQQLRIDIDRKIVQISGGGADKAPMERALRRAARGEFGSIIHLSIGFHPAARAAGQSFIEDIRVEGSNAIGLGIPWWKPGGGENHPDGVVSMQSMWIDGEPVVKDGRVVLASVAKAADALRNQFVPSTDRAPVAP